MCNILVFKLNCFKINYQRFIKYKYMISINYLDFNLPLMKSIEIGYYDQVLSYLISKLKKYIY